MDTPQLGESSEPRSSRTRIKSQRAIESETTQRLLAKARKVEAGINNSGGPTGQGSPLATSTSRSKRVSGSGRKTKPRNINKKQELYCVCKKPTSEDDGPMIECAECNDWFHFQCVNLDEETAERLHTYVCPECEANTGKQSIATYDITTFRSPSPLAGEKKRKASPKPKRASASPHPSVSASSDSGEEAEIGEGESSDTSSDNRSDPQVKVDQPRKRVRANVQRQPSKAKAELPKARVFILDRLAKLVEELFAGVLSAKQALEYATELEESLFENFSDGQGDKATVGARYKTQYNLLDRSLPKARPDLLASIRSKTLSPAQVAVLTSADLASAERLEELEKAKQAALQQTVKSRDDLTGVVRLGRDGFEKVEDAREKEMGALAKQEEAARAEVVRKESIVTEEPVSEVEVSSIPVSTPMPKRSESIDEQKSNFAMTSAWSGDLDHAEPLQISLEDQTALDLSDLVEEEVVETPLVEEKITKPVVWSGPVFQPLDTGKPKPTAEARPVASSRSMVDYSKLMPQPEIEIIGRVPTSSSLQYLNTNRFNANKELIVVVFTPTGDKAGWNEMIELLISRDRHGVCHPHGKNPVPPEGAKELYLVPLRPGDASPEFTDLIDGYDLPSERVDSVFLGVFIANRLDARPLALPVPVQAPVKAPGADPAPAPLAHDKLQALMAQLNPVALQSVAAAVSPYAPAPPVATPHIPPVATPYAGGHTPLASVPVPAYSYQPSNAYQPPYQPYQQSYHQSVPTREYEDRPRDPYDDYAGGEARAPRRREWEKTRDNGWGSRR